MRPEHAILAAALAVAGAAAFAQLPPVEPEWQEAEVPPPPALDTSSLVPVDVPNTALKFGIAPKSLAIGADGVVRYVVVATSRSGAVNAFYEGLRCDRGEYRVYARSSGQAWSPAHTEWRAFSDGLEGRRARAIAAGGACMNNIPNRSPEQMLRDLRTPLDRKFGGSGAP